MYIYDIISMNSFRMTDVSDRGSRENQNTFYVLYILFSENLALYEIMWKNVLQPDGPQMTT
jgi:hypothetical protein